MSGNDEDENSKLKWALETSRRTDGGLDYAREFLGNACPLFTFCMLLHSVHILVNDDFFIAPLCLQEIFRLNARDNCQKNDLSSSHAPQTKNKRQG